MNQKPPTVRTIRSPYCNTAIQIGAGVTYPERVVIQVWDEVALSGRRKTLHLDHAGVDKLLSGLDHAWGLIANASPLDTPGWVAYLPGWQVGQRGAKLSCTVFDYYLNLYIDQNDPCLRIYFLYGHSVAHSMDFDRDRLTLLTNLLKQAQTMLELDLRGWL